MKKIIMAITTLLFFSIILAACGEEKEDSNEPNQTAPETNNEKDDNKPEEDSKTDQEDENNSQDSTGADFETGADDQLDLGIGDTGTFDTTLGTYEITLSSAKLEDEINGESSQLDKFLYLDIVVKNTSDEVQKVEDLLYAMEVSHELERGGASDASDYYGLEMMTGELQPGEEISGQFVGMVYDSDEYFFRKQYGNVEAGSSNQVIWTMKADEVQ